MLETLKRLFWNVRLKPVSRALKIEASLLREAIRNAIAAIDGVHRDGALPDLPVKSALLVDMYGYFLSTTTGKAVEIVISTLNPHMELTTVHEVGHFLDYLALDGSAKWASVNSPVLAKWREAVKRSQAVKNLAHLMRHPADTVTQTLADGSVVEYSIDRPYVEYLLKAEELWARSYSQFITVQGNDPELRYQLDRARDRPQSGLYYGQHWDDADFEPIRAEIASVLRNKRWMK